MIETIYGSIEQTKSNSFVPLLKNGRSLESKYNPEREAQSMLLQIEKPYSFFVVIGVGSGIFINELNNKFPQAIILGVENSSEDLLFLEQIETFKRLKNNKNILLTCVPELNSVLLNNYIPSLHGDIKIVFQKNWTTELPESFENVKEIIQKTIKEISQDYSVQAHFGRIWQKNILSNLKILSESKNESELKIDNSKIAAVIAAGPSLDNTILELKNNRNDYYIISTDTAFQSLIKYEIVPELVVSIDGQSVSANHFISIISSETNFIFDLCANSSITRKLNKTDSNIYFFTNGHPLSNTAALHTKPPLPLVYTGSGTVTIAALDIAIKSGFAKIQLFGADFGYINNKPYTKGTYLDSLYTKSSNFIQSIDKNFSTLMFRTELKTVTQNKKTTDILEGYKLSLENYLVQQKLSFRIENNKYLISNPNTKSISFKNSTFDFKSFLQLIDKENYISLLPYIAWLRNQKEYRTMDFDNLLNLAYKEIVSYN